MPSARNRTIELFGDSGERAVDCNPRLKQGDGYGCVPEAMAYIESYYADDTCETPVAFHPGGAQQTCGRTPTIVPNPQAYFTDTYFEIGTLLDGPVFDTATGCTPYTAPTRLFASFYTVGDAVAFSAFPPLVSSYEGSGRIQLHLLRGEDDVLIAREEFFDTELDTACYATIAGDLKQRCLPSTPYGTYQFLDDTCTDAVFQLSAGETVPPGSYLKAITVAAGEIGNAVYRLGEEIARPAMLYGFAGLDCGLSFVSPTAAYYSTTLLAASEMVEVTTEVE